MEYNLKTGELEEKSFQIKLVKHWASKGNNVKDQEEVTDQ